MIYLSIVFILMNFYYLLNWKKLDKPFIQRDRNSKLDLVYYILKLLSWLWILIGVIFFNNLFFDLLLLSGLIRVPLYHLNIKWSNLWYRLTPPFQIILMCLMLFTH